MTLLRSGPHGNPIWNWDIADASEGYKKLSVVLAGWKSLASTCMLHPQIVFVLQLLKTFQSMADSEGENGYDLSQYKN